MNRLKESIIELKKLLNNAEDYSICRTDKKPMKLWEVMTISRILEKIDLILKGEEDEQSG